MEADLNMGNHQILNVKDPTIADHGVKKKYVDEETAKLTTSTNTKFATAATQRNLKADKTYVDTTFLKLSGGTMTGDINTGGKKITNLPSPTTTSEPATKSYADTTFLKLSGGTMAGDIDASGNKITNLPSPTSTSEPATKHYVDQSHLSQSGIQKNEFLYLMQDVNESSSELHITVLGIKTFPQTPHTINKNAYKFTMKKDAQNKYASRLGFNFYRLPAGAHTFVVEFFPPTQTNVSVNCLSTSINVNHQVFKKTPTYCKNLVQLHKWKISPPEYLMVDIKCDGTSSSPADGTGWMVVYGIEGTHTDVPLSVFDRPFLIHRGDMFMEVDLDMNSQSLTNLPTQTDKSDAATKEYVDKEVKLGRIMKGDINMNANKISNVAYPTLNADAATKGYVDVAGIFSILNSATAAYVHGYIKQNAECLYFCERGIPTETRFTPSTRAISTLFDQTLSGLNATQSIVARRPKLSTGKNAKRFFFTFDGVVDRMISNIDLNPASGADDIVHVFILFRLKSHSGPDSHFRNGLFGHDNQGWDKFVAYKPTTNNLIISGVHGTNNVEVTSSDWQAKADASVLNKWHCLSVHWDVPAGAGKSSCWVNGKKVKTFRAKTSPGSTSMVFGDLDPGKLAPFNGDIQLFLLYKGWNMVDLIIKAHHKMICERYGVDHDRISFP